MGPGMGFILWSRPYIQSESGWCPHAMHATPAPVEMPCQACCLCSSLRSQLWKVDYHFSPLTSCRRSSSTDIYPAWMELPDQHQADFSTFHNLRIWCLQQWSFNHQVLEITKALARVCTVWESMGPQDFSGQQLQKTYPIPSTWFFTCKLVVSSKDIIVPL